MISAGTPLALADGEARARFELRAGQRMAFALQYAPLGEERPRPYSQDEIQALVDTTIARCGRRSIRAMTGPGASSCTILGVCCRR